MSVSHALHDEENSVLYPPSGFAQLLPSHTPTEEAVFQGVSGKERYRVNVFEARNTIAGREIYVAPQELSSELIQSPFSDSVSNEAVLVTGMCPNGTLPSFDGRELAGRISVHDRILAVNSDTFLLSDAITDESGGFKFVVEDQSFVSPSARAFSEYVACFSPAELRHSQEAQPESKIQLEVNGRLTIDYSEQQTGVLVIKVPLVEGYVCRTNGAPVDMLNVHGFAAFVLAASHTVECHYEIPWQGRANALAVAALSVALLASGTRYLRRRRLGPANA